jgi:hypothetical protein
MANTNLQSAKKSLERIYRHGGEDAPFLKQLRTDINNLLRFIAHSFCLREPGQTMELPRGWELAVTSHCNIHHHASYETQRCKRITLVLQKWSEKDHLLREGAQKVTQIWSCGLSHDSPRYGWMTREEIFEFADEIRSGWLDEVADQLSIFRTENLDLGAIRFFANAE